MEQREDAGAGRQKQASGTNRIRDIWTGYLKSAVQGLVLGLALAWLLFGVIWQPAQIPSRSMQNTLLVGDIYLGSCYDKKRIERYDIMVFTPPCEPDALYIKRVMGLPGETVVVEDGAVYADGVLLDDSFLPEPMNCLGDGTFVVPEGCYFMMGDNRNLSNDARFWDEEVRYVPLENMVSKAKVIFYPFSRFGTFLVYDRETYRIRVVRFLAGVILAVLALRGLYLFAIAPRRRGGPDREPFRNRFYAHRGLHDVSPDGGDGAAETDAAAVSVPENSLAAFQRAVDCGYGIELDVQLSRDGIPVVFHDATLDRVCGAEGRVDDYSLEELRRLRLLGTRQRIPTLEEVLKLVDGRVPLIVELKMDRWNRELCPGADALLNRYDGPYCVESFHPLALRWYRKNRPGVLRGQLSGAFLPREKYRSPVYFLLRHLLLNFLGRPDFIACEHSLGDCSVLKRCRKRFHALCVAWTIRSAGELEEAEEFFDLFIFEGFLPKTEKQPVL